MQDSRKKMLDRIRAMLNTGGRTEAEMMAFLAKARELMATYEISEADLNQAEKATIFKTADKDPYEIKRNLSVNVGKFTSCKAFLDREDAINFAGTESDIIFATWLIDTLQRFVMRALRQYQKDLIVNKGAYYSNTLTSSSFVIGCTARINDKLKELFPIDWAKTQELIVKELNINLTKSRRSKAEVNQKSAMAGHEAGKHARFDRPIETGGTRMLK
jgi:hypothetical protein